MVEIFGNEEKNNFSVLYVWLSLGETEGLRERTEYVPQLWNWENHS